MTNTFIIGVAGSGKSRLLIDEIKANSHKPLVATSYTVSSMRNLENRVYSSFHGRVPKTVVTQSLNSLVLSHFVRPYQSAILGAMPPISEIDFEASAPEKVSGNTHPHKRYLSPSGGIYNKRLSEFAVKVDIATGGSATRDFARLFRSLYIDEFQDLAGYFLDLVSRISKAGVSITMAGDPRQAVLATHRENKNSSFRDGKILDWCQQRVNRDGWVRKNLDISYRCTADVCALASSLFSGYPPIQSGTATSVGGVYLVNRQAVEQLASVRNDLQIITFRRDETLMEYGAINVGIAKGLEFANVAIFPPKTVFQSLASRRPWAPRTKSQLYVAITRSKADVFLVGEDDDISLVSGLFDTYSPSLHE